MRPGKRAGCLGATRGFPWFARPSKPTATAAVPSRDSTISGALSAYLIVPARSILSILRRSPVRHVRWGPILSRYPIRSGLTRHTGGPGPKSSAGPGAVGQPLESSSCLCAGLSADRIAAASVRPIPDHVASGKTFIFCAAERFPLEGRNSCSKRAGCAFLRISRQKKSSHELKIRFGPERRKAALDQSSASRTKLRVTQGASSCMSCTSDQSSLCRFFDHRERKTECFCPEGARPRFVGHVPWKLMPVPGDRCAGTAACVSNKKLRCGCFWRRGGSGAMLRNFAVSLWPNTGPRGGKPGLD